MALLPPNSSPIERALAGTIEVFSGVPVTVQDFFDPAKCPAELLGFLAQLLGVDRWSEGWPESVRRAVLSSSFSTHAIKGTRLAIEQVVEAFGGVVAISEWWEKSPIGAPYSFELLLGVTDENGDPTTQQYQNDLLSAVDAVKPVRSYFTVTLQETGRGDLFVSAGGIPVVVTRLEFIE